METLDIIFEQSRADSLEKHTNRVTWPIGKTAYYTEKIGDHGGAIIAVKRTHEDRFLVVTAKAIYNRALQSSLIHFEETPYNAAQIVFLHFGFLPEVPHEQVMQFYNSITATIRSLGNFNFLDSEITV